MSLLVNWSKRVTERNQNPHHQRL